MAHIRSFGNSCFISDPIQASLRWIPSCEVVSYLYLHLYLFMYLSICIYVCTRYLFTHIHAHYFLLRICDVVFGLVVAQAAWLRAVNAVPGFGILRSWGRARGGAILAKSGLLLRRNPITYYICISILR